MRSPLSLPLGALLLAGLTGCSLIPDYHRPALPVASEWPTGGKDARATAPNGLAAADIGWRSFFLDPVAQELIALSLANNRDLRVAALNVAQAEAQFRADRASLFPTLDATAGMERSRTPGSVQGVAGSLNTREYSLGLGVTSWELDFFGRIRSQAEQAHETYLSDIDTHVSTQISLVAQVGSEYLAWLADRDALAISQDAVKAQTDSVRLTRLKAAHGTATGMDVAQAETTLHSAEANVALYTRQVAQD
ncbi:MAG: TolC family protein, partial [Rhodospirillales bacterium]|nr:TolC family protein [Rhodospirillales bacterium]